jgi:hypothetical protein
MEKARLEQPLLGPFSLAKRKTTWAHFPGGDYSSATGINDPSEEVVRGIEYGNGASSLFVWTEKGRIAPFTALAR